MSYEKILNEFLLKNRGQDSIDYFEISKETFYVQTEREQVKMVKRFLGKSYGMRDWIMLMEELVEHMEKKK